MRVLGIITEYNPFHNGHLYHIEQAKSMVNADYVVAVMSGNFMQRGTPAIIHKFARAEMALSCGVDLVLELPTYFATGSAEYFAKGAIAIFDQLGVVTDLVFGSEKDDISLLMDIATVLETEPTSYQVALQNNLKEGNSFPVARTKSLLSLFPDMDAETLSSPNNILGIEYCKALLHLKSKITPHCLLREGGMYHDTSLDEDSFLSSASSIRTKLLESNSLDFLTGHVPTAVRYILEQEYGKSFPIYCNDFSALLQYKLRMDESKGYEQYVDISSDLSDKIKKTLNQFTNFEDYCLTLKSKDITYSRINRIMAHILLNIEQDTLNSFEEPYASYARILGLQKSASPLLHAIKKQSKIPLISKLSQAKEQLDTKGVTLLEADLLSSQIYYGMVSQKFHTPFINEYHRQIVRI